MAFPLLGTLLSPSLLWNRASRTCPLFLSPALTCGLVLFLSIHASFAEKQSPPSFSSPSENPSLSPIPNRIISLAPSLTEIIHALDAENSLVAVTRFCNVGSAASALPKISQADLPSTELLLSLKPDLILAGPLTSPGALRQFRQAKLPFVNLSQDGIEGTLQDIEQIGLRINRGEKAQALCAQIRERLQKVRLTALERSHPRTLLLYDQSDLFSANKETFAGQILECAGGKNVAEKASSRWPRLSMETVLKANPEVILLSSQTATQTVASEALARWKNDSLWSTLDAIKNGRVFVVPDSLLSVPGPRIADAAELLLNLLSDIPSPLSPPP